MLIGALIGTFIGMLLAAVVLIRTYNAVHEFNNNRLNQAMGRSAKFTPNLGLNILLIGLFTLPGAIIGYFVG